MKFNKPVGIISYGTSIPQLRITTESIAQAWGKEGSSIRSSLGVIEKAVPAADEDTISLAVNAVLEAYERLQPGIDINSAKHWDLAREIGAIYVGSESHPYAVKSTAAIVGEVLGAGPEFTAADLEFACKAGTAAMQIVAGMIAGGAITAGIAAGADTAQSRPGDALEFSAAGAAAAFIFGSHKDEILAELLYSQSFTTDTPDFWRREHQQYPSHAGRFTGEPAYFKHITGAVNLALEESGHKISDFDRVVFHMPNGRFPKSVAASLGVTEEQITAGYTVPYLGNSYSACSLIGLSATLDVSSENELILLCSYGSGSGSDAFIFRTTKNLKKFRKNIAKSAQYNQSVTDKINDKSYVEYATYLRNLRKLHD